MLFFTLPSFYQNFNVNAFFTDVLMRHPEFFKAPVTFSEVTGNFPYNYWNGGYNNCTGPACSYNSVFACNQDINKPLRLNCANVLLTEDDYHDAINHTILSLCHDASNGIELCDFGLYHFLKEKYPNYRFIFSKEADLIEPLTPERIDSIHDKGYFKLISLPSRFTTDLETLKTLKVHRDIELTVNSICNLKCQNYDSCRYNQHVYQYNYSNVNPSLTCAKCAPYEHSHILLSLEEIVEKYAPLGFTHYRFDEVIDSPQNSVLTFFIHYFIKPEHQAQVYEYYITGRM